MAQALDKVWIFFFQLLPCIGKCTFGKLLDDVKHSSIKSE